YCATQRPDGCLGRTGRRAAPRESAPTATYRGLPRADLDLCGVQPDVARSGASGVVILGVAAERRRDRARLAQLVPQALPCGASLALELAQLFQVRAAYAVRKVLELIEQSDREPEVLADLGERARILLAIGRGHDSSISRRRAR